MANESLFEKGMEVARRHGPALVFPTQHMPVIIVIGVAIDTLHCQR